MKMLQWRDAIEPNRTPICAVSFISPRLRRQPDSVRHLNASVWVLSVTVGASMVTACTYSGSNCSIMHHYRTLFCGHSLRAIPVCVPLPTSADNVTLLAAATERRPCSNRSISPARRAHSSKPAARCCSGRYTGQTNGWTPCRYVVPAADYASSADNSPITVKVSVVSLLSILRIPQ